MKIDQYNHAQAACKIRDWMRAHKAEYTDPLTGEISATLLGEAAAEVLGLVDDRTGFIEPLVWDIAAEESE